MENQFQELLKKNIETVQNKVFCVGINYPDALKFMGETAFPEKPVIFSKPTTSLIEKEFKLPQNEHKILYELELTFMISKQLKNFKKNQMDYKEFIGGYMIALDFTDATLIPQLRKAGLPWDLAKGQDGFCPISKIISANTVKDPHNLELLLKINGEQKQFGNTKDMHFKIPDILEQITEYITLNPGDIVLTGTPQAAGQFFVGDKFEGFLLQDSQPILNLNLNVI